MLSSCAHPLSQDMDILSSASDAGEEFEGGGGFGNRATNELLSSDRPTRSLKRLSSAMLPDLSYAVLGSDTSARSPQVCAPSSHRAHPLRKKTPDNLQPVFLRLLMWHMYAVHIRNVVVAVADATPQHELNVRFPLFACSAGLVTA